MKTTDASYTVLKYRHDAAAGEVLNVGVVLYSSETGQVGALFSHRYGRLSEAFAGFDGELFHAVTTRLQAALERLGSPLSTSLFQLEERERYPDAASIVRAAWPDQGLAYFAGPALFTLVVDFEEELRDLYDRFVLSQQDPRDGVTRISDDDIWTEVRRVLTPRGIPQKLTRKSLGPAEVEFEHAYQNEKWHAIETISLDYASPSDIKQRALLTVGKAAAVRDLEEFGSMTVIVGRPKRIEAEKAYSEARRLLQDLPVPHNIVEEDKLEQFAVRLESELREHGILPAEAVENKAVAS